MALEKNITSVIPTGDNEPKELIQKKSKPESSEVEKKPDVQENHERVQNDDIKVIGDDFVIKRYSLNECVIYCIFMIFFLVMVTIGRTYEEFNYYTADSIAKALEGDRTTKYFAEVSKVEDFWTYTIEEFIPNILFEDYDNGEPIEDPHKKYFVAETNHLMGGFRIGQKRVSPEKCNVPKALKKSFDWCYPPYSKKKSDRSPMFIDNATNFTVYWQTDL